MGDKLKHNVIVIGNSPAIGFSVVTMMQKADRGITIIGPEPIPIKVPELPVIELLQTHYEDGRKNRRERRKQQRKRR